MLGTVIGNYRIMSLLGEGGMGQVYLAEHPTIGKKLAIKVLRDELAAQAQVMRRFLNEAKTISEIDHPNIVDVLDYGEGRRGDGSTFYYLTMEYLPGESLATLIGREGRLSPERALWVLSEVGDALASAHGKGVVHRDLKPDNIFLIRRGDKRDVVKILDFGIAKVFSERSDPQRTLTGAVLGTPGYMAPEQAQGRSDIDARADIYAAGVVGYEILTGRLPFPTEHGDVLVRQLHHRPPRPTTLVPDLLPGFDPILLKALEPERHNRFQTMAELVSALRSCGASRDVAPAPTAKGKGARKLPVQSIITRADEAAPRGAALRLELAMVERKRWNVASFRDLIEHPLNRELVRELVWATFDGSDQVERTFRVVTGERFETQDGHPYVPGSGSLIGIPHPVELRPFDLGPWRHILSREDAKQPFAQLEREVQQPTPEERLEAVLRRAENIEVEEGRLRSLERRGWVLSGPDSDGFQRSIERPMGDGSLRVVVALDPGIYQQALGQHSTQRLGPAVLRRTGPGTDRLRLGLLHPVWFSELVRDLMFLR